MIKGANSWGTNHGKCCNAKWKYKYKYKCWYKYRKHYKYKYDWSRVQTTSVQTIGSAATPNGSIWMHFAVWANNTHKFVLSFFQVFWNIFGSLRVLRKIHKRESDISFWKYPGGQCVTAYPWWASHNYQKIKFVYFLRVWIIFHFFCWFFLNMQVHNQQREGGLCCGNKRIEMVIFLCCVSTFPPAASQEDGTKRGNYNATQLHHLTEDYKNYLDKKWKK